MNVKSTKYCTVYAQTQPTTKLVAYCLYDHVLSLVDGLLSSTETVQQRLFCRAERGCAKLYKPREERAVLDGRWQTFV